MRNATTKFQHRQSAGRLAPLFLAGVIGMSHLALAAKTPVTALEVARENVVVAEREAAFMEATGQTLLPADSRSLESARQEFSAAQGRVQLFQGEGSATMGAMSPADVVAGEEGARATLTQAYRHHRQVSARLEDAQANVGTYESQWHSLEAQLEGLKANVMDSTATLRALRDGQEERYSAFDEAYMAKAAELTEQSLDIHAQMDEQVGPEELLADRIAARQARIDGFQAQLDAIAAEKAMAEAERQAKIDADRVQMAQATASVRAAESAYATTYREMSSNKYKAEKARRDIDVMSREQGPAASRLSAARTAYAAYGDPDAVIQALEAADAPPVVSSNDYSGEVSYATAPSDEAVVTMDAAEPVVADGGTMGERFQKLEAWKVVYPIAAVVVLFCL